MENEMPLVAREAKTVANTWAGQQEDLPSTRVIVTKGYNQSIGGRLFEIQYTVSSIATTFLLISLYVLDDKTVKIIKDRRVRVRQILDRREILMDDQPDLLRRYEHAEAMTRLVTAVLKNDSSPNWFHGIQMTPEANSHSTVDGYVEIRVSENTRSQRAKVPIKIKTSKVGKATYFKTKPPKETIRVVVLVITPDMEDVRILQNLFHLVEMKVRTAKPKL